MKVHVVKRGISEKDFLKGGRYNPDLKVEIAYCGYLEVENPFKRGLWDLCNWPCWTDEKPAECKNLLLTHCNSDVSYYIDGSWYSHGMHKFSNFNECYKAMVKVRYSYGSLFYALYPHDEGLCGQPIQIVTPENIDNFIK